MTQIRVYAEIEVCMDVEIAGLAADTLEYEVQQRKPEVYRRVVRDLERAFGKGLRKIDYLEFDVVRSPADD